MKNEATKMMTDANRKAIIGNAMNSLDAERDFAELVAQVRRIRYDAYLRKGFTPEQSLTLCAAPSAL